MLKRTTLMLAVALAAACSAADPVDVPDVVGMPLTEARDALEAAELRADEEDASGRGRNIMAASNWIVESQDPAAGSQVQPRSRISLSVANQRDTDEPEADEPEDTDASSEGDAEPSYAATAFDVPDLPVTLELIGCENRVPSDSDRVRPTATVEMTNDGDTPISVRINGAVLLDTDEGNQEWYSPQMDGGRELAPGEIYTMDISPDGRHQSRYGPGRHHGCMIDRVRVWEQQGDLDVEYDPGLGGPSAGDVDRPTTDRVDESIPTGACTEVDGRPSFRESTTLLRQFQSEQACQDALS